MTREQASTAIFYLVGGWVAALVAFVAVWLVRSYSRGNLNNHNTWLTETNENLPKSAEIKFAPGENLHARCQIEFYPAFLFEKLFSKEMYLTNKRIILVRRLRPGVRQVRSILLSDIQNVEMAESSSRVRLSLKSGEIYQIAQIQRGYIRNDPDRERIADFFKHSQD
jgi:hypothetical protein